MTDEALRALERANTASGDAETRDRMERARLRAGLGWHGEPLPRNDRGGLVASDERLVYHWIKADGAVEIQFVYVPGGETRCDACHGIGNVRVRAVGSQVAALHRCSWCRDGVQRIDPFYVGRFPVTWDEYHAQNHDHLFLSDRSGINPVVNVTYWNVKGYCEWAGLRLMTRSEWHWAALGPLVAFDPSEHTWEDEHVGEDDFPRTLSKLYCMRCGDKGVGLHTRPCMRRREFPWGGRPWSPEHCVCASHPDFGGNYGVRMPAPAFGLEREKCRSCRGIGEVASRGELGDGDPDWTKCNACHGEKTVLKQGGRRDLLRPAGASWCGAQDMAGNVWCWRDDATALGGGFRTEGGPQLSWGMALGQELFEANGTPWRDDFSRDDLGFRVAISAVSK